VIRFAGNRSAAWLLRNSFQEDEQFTLPGSVHSWRNLQCICEIETTMHNPTAVPQKFCAHFERITSSFSAPDYLSIWRFEVH
jgi:hypothetical protein